MNATENIKQMLNDLLLGMTLVAMEFSAGFRLRFERPANTSDKPQVLYLDIKAMTYFGELEQWKNFVQSLPIKARRIENDEPAIAYRLLLMIGSEISGVELGYDGTLTIETTDNESITVVGKDDVWDESWLLVEPEDVAGGNARFVSCDSMGGLLAG